MTAGASRGPRPASRIKQPRYQALAPSPAPCRLGSARPSGDGLRTWTCSGDTGDPPRRCRPHTLSNRITTHCARRLTAGTRRGSGHLPARPRLVLSVLTWEGGQQRARNPSRTRTPNSSASTGTRSFTPWNMPAKSRSAGSRSGANPKHLMPSLENDLASVPPDRQ